MSFLSIRRIAQATVVVSLVAGAAGFAAFDKSVTLSVDGKPSAVHLFGGSTVADVLANQGIKLSSHDLVAPATRDTTMAAWAIRRTERKLTALQS